MTIRQKFNGSAGWLTMAAVGLTAFGAPSLINGATDAQAAEGNEIIVTARRVEERLQDVPISITVLDAKELANNNIIAAKDIATYTPGLSLNSRFGADTTSFTIRGFTQEIRTTATVGTFFADVVAPRGSGASQGGDGAGPGALFDLQNIQVLKGPQGTLFGRNSTGGAVLLVPQKPTSKLEGYVEGTLGDYDLKRVQGVVNVPVNENLRIRVGIDHNERDGYLENAGRLGFGRFGDAGGSVDYTSARFSAVWDITPSLENYFIASYSESESTSVIPKITRTFAVDPATTVARYDNLGVLIPASNTSTGANGVAAAAQAAREAPLGFWSVSNPLPNIGSTTETWQAINTTTWQFNENLTIKNILSYAEFLGDNSTDLFGFYNPIVTPGTETNGGQVRNFNGSSSRPGGFSNAQSSFVEELQFQGDALDGRLTWQAGLYYESNEPIERSGILSSTFTPCADLLAFACNPFSAPAGATSLGRQGWNWSETTFTGKAAYAQASYDLNEKWKATAGIRYTEDEVESRFAVVDIRHTATFAPGTTLTSVVHCANTATFGAVGSATNPRLPLSQRDNVCAETRNVETDAPTWLLGLDYKPTDDVLLYGKYSRGYRQGGVSSFAGDKLQNYDKEVVDTFELGAKTNWGGAIPGHFNVALFHNDFSDQQLNIGLSCNPTALCAQTTAVLNVGKSTLQGFEAEVGVRPIEGLKLEASWAHLETEIEEIEDPGPKVRGLGLPFTDIRALPLGEEIPNTVPDKATFSANYTLPLSDSVGKITFGGTVVYNSEYRVSSDPTAYNAARQVIWANPTNLGIVPSYTLLNLSATWEGVAGRPVDIGVFGTNVTEEEYFVHANVQPSNGFVSNLVGEPSMWGVRVKYRFGG